MVCSELAVTLQCLGKLHSGIIYSGKQRNIYEHIYRIYSPTHCKPPPHTKTYIRGAISNSGKHYMFAITFM